MKEFNVYEDEYWKDVPGYEGLYQVSSFGRVRSLTRNIWNGKSFYKKHGTIIKQFLNECGYPCIVLSKNNKRLYLRSHKLMQKSFPCHFISINKKVDHIDGNKLNTRLDNLRACNSSMNNINRKKSINTSSKYKGVSFDKYNKKWQSRIKKDYKTIHLGRYKDEKEAAIAYDNKARELFGEFAVFNFPFIGERHCLLV